MAKNIVTDKVKRERKRGGGWDLPLLFLRLKTRRSGLGINEAKYDNLFTNGFINLLTVLFLANEKRILG